MSAPATIPARGERETVAFVCPKPPGGGGLGRLAEDVLHGLVESGARVHAFGPAAPPRVREGLPGVTWHEAPPPLPAWVMRWTWLRWWTGQYVHLYSARLGRWAAREVAAVHPDRCYLFAEVARETLAWTRERGIPVVLDNPTGDVRHFRDANVREARRWTGAGFRGHPGEAMTRRSVAEYAQADVTRVASAFSRASMIERGVPPEKVAVVPYPIDVSRFVPPASPRATAGPVRLCYVASIALAKGFQYLLEAVHAAGAGDYAVELVGGTESRGSRRTLERLGAGLALRTGPVPNLVEAYHRAELFVLPTLHDGWGYVVPEAMACALPVVVTDTCGARDLVEHGRTGWVVPAGDSKALTEVLREARRDRARLGAMGEAARESLQGRSREWEGAFARWWMEEAPGARRSAAGEG